MPGLMWLSRGRGGATLPGSMTFVRGADERTVLTGLGVDPDDAMLPENPGFSSTPGVTLIRSGDWLVALEQAAWPRGIRPDVLRRLSVGTEVVVIHEDIAKGNHELAHAADGEVITGVMTLVPPSWAGTQPDRLRPLAEELGMQREDGSRGPDDFDLGDIEILLIIAEAAFGLSLDEADLNSPVLKVPDQPADPTPRRPASAAPLVVRTERIRPHVQRLVDSGLTADVIAAQAGLRLSANGIGFVLSGANFWIPVKTAERILAIEAPPQSAQ
jgi:Family of unknown function (DUF6461)